MGGLTMDRLPAMAAAAHQNLMPRGVPPMLPLSSHWSKGHLPLMPPATYPHAMHHMPFQAPHAPMSTKRFGTVFEWEQEVEALLWRRVSSRLLQPRASMSLTHHLSRQ